MDFNMVRWCKCVFFIIMFIGNCVPVTSSLTDLSASTNHWNISTVIHSGFGVFRNFLNQRQLNETVVTCLEDIAHLSKSVEKFEMWALKMLDASGKPQRNVLQGATIWFGSYDDCLEIHHSVSPSKQQQRRSIDGAYVQVTIPLPQNISTEHNLKMLSGINIRWDLCVPGSCSTENVISLINNSTDVNMGISVTSVKLNGIKNIKNDTAAIVSLAILGCFVLFCIIGTVVDLKIENTTKHPNLVSKPNEEQTVNKTINGQLSSGRKIQNNSLSGTKRLLLAFSVRKNGRNILNSSAPPGSLGCLNGIRVLSIAWVILSHFMETVLNQVENKKDFKDMSSTFWFQVVYNGTLAVDTFFFLSGLLVAYQFLREVKKTGKITGKQMALFYFHRYFRLTPLYMIVLMIYTNIAPYFTVGILSSPLTQGRPENCKAFWWTNLLYINNLYHSGRQEMCMLWSWYLANDMQFYIISPLVLIPLSLGHRVIGFVFMFGMVAGQIISGGYIGWSVGDSGLTNSHSSEFFDEIYIKPYARMGVYAVGLLLGYIIASSKKRTIPKTMLIISTIFIAISSMLVTYLTYDKYKENRDGWNSDANIAYETMFRPVWSLVLFWLIYVCLKGYGGFINTILSWNVWIPLSRITYAAYLVHLIILSSFMADLRSFGYLNMFYIVNNYIGIVFLTYGASFILTIIVESPFVGIEKVLLRR